MLDCLLSESEEEEKVDAEHWDREKLEKDQCPSVLQRIQLLCPNRVDGGKVKCAFAPSGKGRKANLNVLDEDAEEECATEEERSRAEGGETDEAVESEGGYDVCWEKGIGLVTIVEQIAYRCDTVDGCYTTADYGWRKVVDEERGECAVCRRYTSDIFNDREPMGLHEYMK